MNAATWRQPNELYRTSVRAVRPLQKSIHRREHATRPGLYVVVISEILVRGSRDGLARRLRAAALLAVRSHVAPAESESPATV